MYPPAETSEGWIDPFGPDDFKREITVREIARAESGVSATALRYFRIAGCSRADVNRLNQDVSTVVGFGLSISWCVVGNHT
jgi:UDP-glucose 4-epimerase